MRKEFPDDITIGDIHEKLVKRKKLPAESYLEYFYEMQRIGKNKMDEKSIIQYIVNGIQDSILGKAILYDSASLEVLKSKIKTYEVMRSQRDASVKPKSFEKKHLANQSSSESTYNNSSGKRCYNSGSKSHQSQACPDKSKGSRCFNCNKFGHMARDCKEKKAEVSGTPTEKKPMNTISVVPQPTDAHVFVRHMVKMNWMH